MTRKPAPTLTRKQRRQIQLKPPERGPERFSPGSEPSGAGWLPRLLPWLSVALAIAVYGRALAYPFISDDTVTIVNNPGFMSWKFLPHYFLHNIWDQPGKATPSNYYRPLGGVHALVMYHLFGWKPAGWHAVVILLHAVATLLLYWLAVRTLKNRTAAGIAAALFAVLPAHVESVTWISAAGDVEYSLFFIAAILCYLRWRDGLSVAGCPPAIADASRQPSDSEIVSRKSKVANSGSVWFGLSLLCFALSLLAKEPAVVLCAMIFFYEWKWAGSRQPATGSRQPGTAARQPVAQRGSRQPTADGLQRAALRVFLVTLPYGVLTVAYLAARANALRGMMPLEVNQASRASILLSYPETFWFYLAKMFWPFPASLFYPLRVVGDPGDENFLWPLLASLLALAGLWLWSRRSEAAGIASAWLLLPLAPPVYAISHFPPDDMVHDRYLYLPSVGAAMLIALALSRVKPRGRSVSGAPVLQLSLAALLVCLLGGVTVVQAHYWSGGMALYGHAAEVAPHNLKALNGIARSMTENPYDPHELLKAGERILQDDPDAYETLVGVGRLRWEFHDYDNALPVLLRARRGHPERRDAYFWLGAVYLDKQQFSDAETAFRQAIHIDPNVPDQHVGLGMAYENEGRLAEARSEYLAELHAYPNSVRAAERLKVVESRLNGKEH
jgi:tetratricopeptide (TPR) repeat protein